MGKTMPRKKTTKKKAPKAKSLSTGDALYLVRKERRALQASVHEALCDSAERLPVPGSFRLESGEVVHLPSVPDLVLLDMAKSLTGAKVSEKTAWKRIYPDAKL